MPRRPRPLLAAAAAAVLGVALLAGCATGGVGSSSAPTPSAEASTTAPPADVDVSVGWLDGGAMIAVALRGSSTCVPYADSVTVSDGVLHVSLVEADQPCTRDSVLRAVAVPTPAGVAAADDIAVEVTGEGYRGSAMLAGVAGLAPAGGVETAQPSAGWLGPDAFALLTWGSSSCRPTVADVAVQPSDEIAVTFATPPRDEICTADMAPRVSVVSVAGAVAGTAYTAVVAQEPASGDPLRVPIAGTP
ncbi:hypothetical protein ACIQLJ_01905 [Microbacterium sp. NPDC091313]